MHPRLADDIGALKRRPLMLVSGAVAVLVRVWLGPYVTDDAYITFRYSENLAAGLGFTYNPPDRVLGTTAPLYALALILPAALELDLGWTTLIVAALADVVTLLCGAALLIRAGWPMAALLYSLGIACWPGLVTYSVSGLETSLYMALLTFATLAVDSQRGRTAGVVLALATMCRPDGALMAGLLVLALLRRSAAEARSAVRAYVLTLLPWAAFSLFYFHSIIPASVAAKAHTRLPAAKSLTAFAIRFWRGSYLVLTPLAAAGAVFASTRPRPVFLAVAVWWITYSVIFIATGAFGPYPWYFVPLLPAYLACLAIAIERVVSLAVPARIFPRAAVAFACCASLVLASRLPALRSTLELWFDGRERLYELVATTVTRDTTCTMAATEIGTLGYFYHGRILDLVGLVSPEATSQPVAATLDSRRPCWVVTYDDLIDPSVLRSGSFQSQHDVAFRQRVGPTRELLVFKRR